MKEIGKVIQVTKTRTLHFLQSKHSWLTSCSVIGEAGGVVHVKDSWKVSLNSRTPDGCKEGEITQRKRIYYARKKFSDCRLKYNIVSWGMH